MNIPRLLGVLFEIKAEGTTVHLDVRRYPPPTGSWIQNFTCHVVHWVIVQRDDRRPRVVREGCLSTTLCLSHARIRLRTFSPFPLPACVLRDLITNTDQSYGNIFLVIANTKFLILQCLKRQIIHYFYIIINNYRRIIRLYAGLRKNI